MLLTGTRGCQEGVATKRRRSTRKAICLLAGLALTAIISMTTRADDRQGRDDEATFTCTVQVVAGQSIQAAIDGAPTGATCVSVRAPTGRTCLSPRMASPSRAQERGKRSLNRQPSQRPVCLKLFFPPIDYENNGLNGICVANVDADGHGLGVVNDVRVTGFTIQGFPGVGIVFADTNRSRADHNVAANNRATASLPSTPRTAGSSTTRVTAAMTPASTWATRQRPTLRSDTTPLLPTSGGFSCGTRPEAA